MRLLLASQSETRKRMLAAAGIDVKAVSALIDEEQEKQALIGDGLAPRALARALAEVKALHAPAEPGDLVVGSDQTLERDDGSVLGKAKSPAELVEQLTALSGHTHLLHAAAAVVEDGHIVWKQVETVQLAMRKLSSDFIASYVEDHWATVRFSVGGYHVEGAGAQLFERIEGSHFAALGLPLLPLLAYFRERRLMAS